MEHPTPSLPLALRPIAAAALLALGAPAFAQTTPTTNTVVITGTPIVEANEVDGHAGFSTRVTETQVREAGALDLAAALRMTPGVQISRYNEVGSYSGDQGGNVYIRGIGASRPGGEIKTYLDGVPLYMGLWNHPLMDLLPTYGVRSIEVRKGPQNMSSGNNFGAIELHSRAAAQAGVQGDAEASVGSWSTRILRGSVVGRQGDVDFMLAGGTLTSDGARANADADLTNLMGRIAFRVTPAWSVGGSFLVVRNKVGDPGDDRFPVSRTGVGPYAFSNGVGRNDSTANLMTAFVTHQHGDWRGEFKVYENRGHNNLVDDANWGTFDSEYRMWGFRWKETMAPWSGGKLTAGIDHENVSGRIAGPNVGASVGTPFAFGVAGAAEVPGFRLSSAYAGLSHQIDVGGGWVLLPSAGARLYDSNHYDSKIAPNAGLSLVSERITVYANLTRGLLYPGAETYTLTRAIPMAFTADNGWDRLSPTEARHAEIGVKWTASARTSVDASLFQDDISKRYVWSGFFAGAIANPASGTWSNGFPDYRIRGVEVSVRHRIAASWSVFGGVTTLDSSLDNLPYAPKTAFSAGVSGRFGPWRVGADAQHQSKMYSLTQDRGAFTPNEVAAFTVANARVAYALPVLGKRGEVYAVVNNVLDAKYAYNAGYPMPGRNVRIGVSASF